VEKGLEKEERDRTEEDAMFTVGIPGSTDSKL
jgi:hypothetical protein